MNAMRTCGVTVLVLGVLLFCVGCGSAAPQSASARKSISRDEIKSRVDRTTLELEGAAEGVETFTNSR